MINFKSLALTALIGLTSFAPMAAQADLRGEYSGFQEHELVRNRWCKAQFDKVTHEIESRHPQLFIEHNVVKVYNHGYKGQCFVKNLSKAELGVQHHAEVWGDWQEVVWFVENGEIVKYSKRLKTGHMARKVFKATDQYTKDWFITSRGGHAPQR
jgi:hypothetical protein